MGWLDANQKMAPLIEDETGRLKPNCPPGTEPSMRLLDGYLGQQWVCTERGPRTAPLAISESFSDLSPEVIKSVFGGERLDDAGDGGGGAGLSPMNKTMGLGAAIGAAIGGVGVGLATGSAGYGAAGAVLGALVGAGAAHVIAKGQGEK